MKIVAAPDEPLTPDSGIMPPVNVVHVITRLIIGGAQENTILSCEGLAARGYRVTLISGPTTGPEGTLVERARRGDYEFIELPELRRAVNPWLDARARRQLRTLFQRLEPDIVHTHSSKAGIIGRFAARDARMPRVVHTIHGMSFNRTQPWFVRRAYAWLERQAARRTHAIVSVADAMTTQTVAARVCRPEKCTTIYSGMEIAPFTPQRRDRDAVRRAWGVGADDIVVGTVARLFTNKGYEQLLSIMSLAAEREPRLRFVWVGDGAQREDYEFELEHRRLRDRTTLTGLVAPETIPSLLAGFDVLAHPSQWEGLPRTVVQALLMQVPAVAFDIDGTPEVVLDQKTGRLIALNDEAGFADALTELASSPDERTRMGRAGRELCRERFSAENMVAALDRLYRRMHA